MYKSIRSVNQLLIAKDYQPSTLYTACIRAVLYTAFIELINTHSTILLNIIRKKMKRGFKNGNKTKEATRVLSFKGKLV